MANTIITIIIPVAERQSANQWMQDNLDMQGGLQSFKLTFTSRTDGLDYVLANLSCADSEKDMIESHFTNVYEGDTRITSNGSLQYYNGVSWVTIGNTDFLVANRLLKEDGGLILQETGDAVIIGWEGLSYLLHDNTYFLLQENGSKIII